MGENKICPSFHSSQKCANQKIKIINFLSFNFNNVNFHPHEVVSRYRDPQLQVGENYSYLQFMPI